MPKPLSLRPTFLIGPATNTIPAVVERIFLETVGCVGGIILAGWLAPPIAHWLPGGWSAMKANTALVSLLLVASLVLTKSRGQNSGRRTAGLVVAGVAFLVSLLVLTEYWFDFSLRIDTLLAADLSAAHPGRMAPQTATAFCLTSLLVLAGHFRNKVVEWVADLVAMVLCLVVLAITAGYLFGALQLFGVSMGNRVSPQTLICVSMLTLVIVFRRTDRGVFSILVSKRLGGQISRRVGPVVLLLPFVLEAMRINFARWGLASPAYATALATSVTAILAACLVMVMAQRIDGLEKRIMDLSVLDDLTKINNRKGFFSLANVALERSRIAKVPFSVLFIDLDGLKTINDKYGHEAGSAGLCALAELLMRTFRSTDVLGRIGGDEFVVAGQWSQGNMELAAKRLEVAAAEYSFAGKLEAPVSFSAGHVTAEVGDTCSLENLLSRADFAMYEAKRRKQFGRGVDAREVVVVGDAI